MGQVQTPNQRKGNERYAKFEAAKRGKPESVIKAKKKDFKSPVSTVWIGVDTPTPTLLKAIQKAPPRTSLVQRFR